MQRNDLLGVLVATFSNQACAEEAIRDLHHAGVRHTWLGVTKSGEEPSSPRAAAGRGEAHERVDDLSVGHVIARWLHRDHDETLYEALREHGVADEEARHLDGAVAEGNTVLIVEDVLEPTAAASIAVRHGGTLVVTPDEIDASAYEPARDPLVEARAEAARRNPAARAGNFR